MSWQQSSARDISLRITSAAAAGEQRISPSWTISQLKKKLESITGIPPSSQHLNIKGSLSTADIEAQDQDAVQIGSWGLSPASEIEVIDTRPASQRDNFSVADSNVPKYELPVEKYSELPDSVLAWKRSHQLGRFDPAAPALEASKAAVLWEGVEQRGIEVGRRCRVGGGGGGGDDDDGRRGVVRFVGEVPELPGVKAGAWVGVELDEPVGRNDGFVGGGGGGGEGEATKRRKVFECAKKRGVFVRPDRVVVGDFPVLEVGVDEDMEEI